MARYPEVFTLWEQCEGIGLGLFIYTNNTAGIRFWESTGWTFRAEISLISRDLDPVCGGDC